MKKQDHRTIRTTLKKPHSKLIPSTLEQRKHEAYSKLGKKGGEARARQLGHDGYVALGRMGGRARAEQLAREGYDTSKKTPKKHADENINGKLDDTAAKEDKEANENHNYTKHKKSS